jgi:excinuclease UvrABC ATPase subunit
MFLSTTNYVDKRIQLVVLTEKHMQNIGNIIHMKIKIPKLSLVVMIGVSSAGKSSFARKHFKQTEIVSSDECRAIISDD